MREARLPRLTSDERLKRYDRKQAWQKSALATLAEKRKAICLKRVNRWASKDLDPRTAPGHILAMASEAGVYL